MKQKLQKRVCVVETIYSFLLYLLYSTEDEIKNTYFFTSSILASLLKNKGIDYHCFKNKEKGILRILFKISLKFFSHFRWRFLKTACFFGQDHIQFFAGLVKNRKYTLIEDSPFIFSNFPNTFFYKQDKKMRKSFAYNIVRFLYGNTFACGFGQNNQSENIILTQEHDLKFLNDKQTTLLNLEKSWQNSSAEKQKLILDLFNIDLSAPIFSKNKSIIILTSPFTVDMPNFTEQEQIDLYREIVESYDKNKVVIKTHPRDKINYSNFFPDIEVFNKPIPMQLLSLLGVRFEKAVTVFSSSVLDFPYEIEIEKIGTSCNKKIEDYFYPKNSK